MSNDKRYESAIRRGADAIAREIDLEVLESLKKFDCEQAVKNINDPLREIRRRCEGKIRENRKNEKSEGSPRK